MIKLQILTLFSLVLVTLCLPTSAYACACCAEPGYYSIRTAKPSAYEMGEIMKLKFENPKLYTDAGYPETTKGIAPLGESFSVKNLFDEKVWAFDFKDDNQKNGRLDLSKPLSMVEFMVDLPDDKENENEMVKLYKEWRFKYKVRNATGFFKSGFTPANEYFLVLQGYGNVCTSAADFTKWRLEISGRKADFTFYGKLDTD